MSQSEEYRQRVIAGCDKHDEIALLDDGFQYFWVQGRGAMSAFDLRIIADELDRRNKAWQDQIEREFSNDKYEIIDNQNDQPK